MFEIYDGRLAFGGTIEYTPTLTATTESKTSNYDRCVRI